LSAEQSFLVGPKLTTSEATYFTVFML